MQPDLHKLFEIQTAWQQARAKLPWPEKIRMAEAMLESARQLRRLPLAKHRSQEVTPSAKVEAESRQ
jgi:hypothetical protein